MQDVQAALAQSSSLGAGAEDELNDELKALYAEAQQKEAEEVGFGATITWPSKNPKLQAMTILAGGGGYVAPTPAAPAEPAAAKAAPLAS